MLRPHPRLRLRERAQSARSLHRRSGLGLFGYNLGVEFGQVTIVLIAAPLLLHLSHHRRLYPLVRGLAALIFIAGIYWFFQRLG